MKLSEMIKKFQEIKSERGDLEVKIANEASAFPITSIEISLSNHPGLTHPETNEVVVIE